MTKTQLEAEVKRLQKIIDKAKAVRTRVAPTQGHVQWRAIALTDEELVALVHDRRLLLRQLAEVLRRIGPSNKNRVAINRERAEQRKALNKAIRDNERQTAIRCAALVPNTRDDS